MSQTPNKTIWTPDYEIYIPSNEAVITQRKLEGLKKLAEIKQWGIRNPTKFMKQFIGVDLLDSQEYVFMNSWNKPFCLWLESRGAGKALDLDTRIPTPSGDKTMRDIEIGDYVFDEKGKPTKVIAISPIFYDHDCYEVEFSDGEKIIADADHLWEVNDHNQIKTINTELMFKTYLHPPRKNHPSWKQEKRYSVELCKPLEYEEKELPIHPYVLGLWLGDGKSDDGYITTHRKDCDEMVSLIKSTRYKVSSIYDDSGNNKRIRILNQYDVPLRTLLRENNLFFNKHIPESYLLSSTKQRLELMQGLMDTDGTIDKRGTNLCEFTQSIKHERLINDFSCLLSSFGIKHKLICRENKLQNNIYKSIRISFKISKNIPCFKLNRKISLINTEKNIPVRTLRKTIVKVASIESRPTKCICVDSPSHLYLCGEKNTVTHNSTMLALYFMTKGLLFNNYWAYICSGNADQAQETFRKIEDIAKKNIESMTGLTDVFVNELVKNQANTDGFVRSPMGFTYKLYNGSFVKTLNSNIDGKRGKRANAVCFDEGSWLTEEIFNVIGAFTAVNKDFKLGGDVDVNAIPREIPNQLLYASSASSVDTAFYNKYRDFSKKMFLGDDRYFVADINCDIVIHATRKGIALNKSLLSQETVDNEMRNNPEKALREYYNRFTKDGGVNQIIKRSLIVRNSEKYVPVMYNDTGERKFVLCYDPARNIDNSTVLICEILDTEDGYKLRVVNSVNFTDLNIKKKKKPMRTPDQIAALKELIVNYNGKDVPDYDNIFFLIDGGSGGGGNLIPDFFMEDWKDKAGKTHKGLLDKEYSADYIKQYPTAINKIKVVTPSAYKSQMYEALIKMVESDLIIFPEHYDNHGYLVFTNEDTFKVNSVKQELYAKGFTDEEVEEKLSEMNLVQQETYKLSLDEENALSQIDAMKEEIVNICRTKRDGGKDAFKLPAHKDADTGASEGTMHKHHCALAA